MKKVAFFTLGCKLNQAETAIIARQFGRRGYRVVSAEEKPDVFVVNTCTVTERSAAKSRKAVRKMSRENPDTVIIVTGCYAQVSKSEAIKIKGVDCILGTQEKLHIFDYFPEFEKKRKPIVRVTERNLIRNAETGFPSYPDNTRAFLKIQDGCDSFCTYCIVPYTRGPSRSVDINTIIDQAKNLISEGFKEIVLTGVHIGKWSMQEDNSMGLTYLLKKLLEIDYNGRIRLSSLEPEEVTDELLDYAQHDHRVCRHFHISLQSGSNSVLKRMNRLYTTGIVQNRIDSILSRFPNAGLGCDVITGFPGETEKEFNETLDFISRNNFTYLHVFPYSVRKGTAAANFSDQVASEIRKKRAAALRELGRKEKTEFIGNWIGKKVSILAEDKKRGNTMSGLTSEYLRVEIPFQKDISNTFVNVLIKKPLPDRAAGKVVV
ncbi:tRNA (N(6)-L-threonylcarbamoyladenosine(37)-C(2))-methylthiotransferase MtaB [bacterium]|nr:tRNA (N(6)-L-threonylcarbamoyladenosine(37)-C(2))-methylthiotransferase MtaB [bacterium]